jgi:hypothetical protein
MKRARLRWGLLVGVAGLLPLVACTSGSGSSAGTSVVLRGDYEATEPGGLLAITFFEDDTYTVKRNGSCSAGNAFCVDHGTYAVDETRGVVTLTSEDSGKSDELPYTVLSSRPLVGSSAGLRVLGGSGTSLTSGADASLTSGADATLTQDAATLTVEINIALTITLGGQSVSAGNGPDNGDAGGNTEGGITLTFPDGGNPVTEGGGSGTQDGAGMLLTSSDAGGVSLTGGDSGSGNTGGGSDGGNTGSGSGSGGTGGSDAGSSSMAGGGSDAGATSGMDASSDASSCPVTTFDQKVNSSTWAAYSPSKAITYADAHWSDGVGECAAFVSASVTAGGVALNYPWVPDLVTALSGVAYDEYSPSNKNISAAAGDIIVYSNATGSSFCTTHSTVSRNCGHAGLVVTAGGATTATADFHNGGHHHLGIQWILEGTTVSPTSNQYSTYRVYHTAALAGGCKGT